MTQEIVDMLNKNKALRSIFPNPKRSIVQESKFVQLHKILSATREKAT
jgi:hypothetical protein